MCWKFWLSFILQSTAAGYLISPSPLTCVHSANFSSLVYSTECRLIPMSPAAETAVSQEERGSRHALSWLLFDFISNITSSWLLYSQCLQVLNPSRLIVFLVSAAGTFDFFVSLKEFFFISTQIPLQLGVFRASRFKAAGMLVSVVEVEGRPLCIFISELTLWTTYANIFSDQCNKFHMH